MEGYSSVTRQAELRNEKGRDTFCDVKLARSSVQITLDKLQCLIGIIQPRAEFISFFESLNRKRQRNPVPSRFPSYPYNHGQRDVVADLDIRFSSFSPFRLIFSKIS